MVAEINTSDSLSEEFPQASSLANRLRHVRFSLEHEYIRSKACTKAKRKDILPYSYYWDLSIYEVDISIGNF